MIEYIILGIIQGIAEWLPVSSEGLLIITKSFFFSGDISYKELIRIALLLHFGTFLAALVYFWKDVVLLIKTVFSFKTQSRETKNIFIFLATSTIISGLLGLLFISLLENVFQHFLAGKTITLCIGFLLLFTAYLQIKAKDKGHKNTVDITTADGIILGIAQGFATLPGLSRSGLTVSSLLLLNFEKETALKLSFLMSLPIVLAGNILLNFSNIYFSPRVLLGIFFSFLFGLATIKSLLFLAKKFNFGYFVGFFGLLTILASFL